MFHATLDLQRHRTQLLQLAFVDALAKDELFAHRRQLGLNVGGLGETRIRLVEQSPNGVPLVTDGGEGIANEAVEIVDVALEGTQQCSNVHARFLAYSGRHA